eukprot:NODE_20124_length_812_cov_3.283212.p1 GENE.NODE_20124_length_812_cov_3.283212~~NODE_20124_length_812_cov_3.283212.p1  ORF type:complete len:120 (+),score=25.87 NODE_20124_length_812_cov_3.283212:154-513(+)
MAARSALRRAALTATMPLASTETITGHKIIEYKGMAMGSTVRTRDVTKDFTMQIKAIFGGELSRYTELLADAREEAISRLRVNAKKQGGNAVVGLRMTTSNITGNASEVMAYGTAVLIE